MPAWARRCAASSPDMPAPMTATRNGTSAATSSFVPARGAEVGAVEGELLLEHRQVLVDLVAHEEVQHRAQVGGGAAAGAVACRRRGGGSGHRRRGSTEGIGLGRDAGALLDEHASWSGASSGRTSERSPVAWATATSSGGRSASATAASDLLVGGGDRARRRPGAARPASDLLVAAGPVLVAQHPLRAASRLGAGQLVADLPRAGPLVAGEVDGGVLLERADVDGAARPGATTACTDSPHSSDGMPKTAASITSAWAWSTASISAG